MFYHIYIFRIEEVMTSIAQQAVEKIDRTRDVAGQVFAHLLHHE